MGGQGGGGFSGFANNMGQSVQNNPDQWIQALGLLAGSMGAPRMGMGLTALGGATELGLSGGRDAQLADAQKAKERAGKPGSDPGTFEPGPNAKQQAALRRGPAREGTQIVDSAAMRMELMRRQLAEEAAKNALALRNMPQAAQLLGPPTGGPPGMPKSAVNSSDVIAQLLAPRKVF